MNKTSSFENVFSNNTYVNLEMCALSYGIKVKHKFTKFVISILSISLSKLL